MVEPSPFTYVCGYKNRFTNMIKYLREEGCEVLVVTTGKGVTVPWCDSSGFETAPDDFQGAKIVSTLSIGCPWYWPMPLSFALSPRIFNKLKQFQPDIIHCSSPGLMVLSSKLYSWMLKIPLVLSYHTHIPKYLENYRLGFLQPLVWAFLGFLHWSAHLTLATSSVLQNELIKAKAAQKNRTQVWQRGVDTDVFSPSFKSAEMRVKLTDGHPDDPVMVHVGRLGHEKNLAFLKNILQRIPNLRLAFVGDGPAREELEEQFQGTKTVFLGMLHGSDLSQAYASGDLFAMPSESETLGFVVLEAMASGTPVVAVHAGGIPDIVTQHGINGFLYESENIDQAVQYVHNLLNDTALRKRVALAGRDEVSKWDWRAATRKLLNVQYTAAISAAWATQGTKLAERVQQLAVGDKEKALINLQ